MLFLKLEFSFGQVVMAPRASLHEQYWRLTLKNIQKN
jgi:hypothetical protein